MTHTLSMYNRYGSLNAKQETKAYSNTYSDSNIHWQKVNVDLFIAIDLIHSKDIALC